MIPLADGNPTQRTAVVTILIIIACAAVYFFVQPTPTATTRADALFNYEHALVPLEVRTGSPLTNCELAAQLCGATTAQTPIFPGKHVYLALVVSMFLHGSLIHLAGNMLFLWIFGNNIEDRLGRIAFPIFYAVAGLVAAGGYVIVNPSSTVPLVGASGAIAGVMGAYLVWFPRARVVTLIGFIPLPLPAWVMLAVWFVLQFFTGPDSAVAWVAHVAGFVFGVAVALLLRERGGLRPRRTLPV